MRVRYVLLVVFLTLLTVSSYAQTNQPITPKSGYWQSTIVENTSCEGKDGVTWRNFAIIGSSEIIPVTLSEDGNGIHAYMTLRRYQNGYHSDLFPDRPETLPAIFGFYGNLRVATAEQMTLDMGVYQESAGCHYYTTYELVYLGEERPIDEGSSFRAGYWTITPELDAGSASYCEDVMSRGFIMNGNGIPQYQRQELTTVSNGDYYLEPSPNSTESIRITSTSDEAWTGDLTLSQCHAMVSGEFERDFLTASNYDDLGNDVSVILDSGLWNVFNTPTTTLLEGTCTPPTNYISNVIYVSPDGQYLDLVAGTKVWTLFRDERGLYTGAYESYNNQPSYLVIEPITNASLNYYYEFSGEGCVVVQDGRGSWDGDLLSPTVKPILEEDLPPLSETLPDCTISTSGTVNLRSGAGTNFDLAGSLQAGESEKATARSEPIDGFTWYYLARGAWVREDVVTVSGECEALPFRN